MIKILLFIPTWMNLNPEGAMLMKLARNRKTNTASSQSVVETEHVDFMEVKSRKMVGYQR